MSRPYPDTKEIEHIDLPCPLCRQKKYVYAYEVLNIGGHVSYRCRVCGFAILHSDFSIIDKMWITLCNHYDSKTNINDMKVEREDWLDSFE